MKKLSEQIDWEKSNGLVPAVVINSITGKVLMVAWCNREALDQTIATGQVTFFSRSRQQLWRKGETSGNTLTLTSINSDCDNDTLLIEAVPAGPTCHTGKDSCFDSLVPMTGFGFLGQLQGIIHAYKSQVENQADSGDTAVTTSYTTELLRAGTSKMAQKVGEEGVEVALAAVEEGNENLKNESADLIYHLLVLLAHKDLKLEQVVTALRERHLLART